MGMTMDAPWGAADYALTFLMWSVMMVVMMAPSAWPVLRLYAGMRAGPTGPAVFAVGYFAVWIAFSAVATLAQSALHAAALLSPAMAVVSPRLAAAILVVAGVYQLTPAKSVCLTQCQSPLGFLMANWRAGASGALRMGMRHGVYCLGCCWALMTVLFAVGVMNLVWVAALALLVLLEKRGVGGVALPRAAGVVMLAAGVFIVV